MTLPARLRRLAAVLLLLSAACIPSAAAAERLSAFVGGTLIDGSGSPPIPDAALLVAGDRILAVGPAAEVPIPGDAARVDTSGRWIIPGLIDAHVHFFQSGGIYTRPDILDLRAVRPYAVEIEEIRKRLPKTLARYLASGVTGVVDLGGPYWNFEVRALAQSLRVAPRVAVAGPLLATYAPSELAGPAGPPMIRISTAAEAEAEVERQLRRAPDLVKIWFVRPGRDLGRELTWIRAAIAASHAAGVRVVAHATQPRVAQAVVGAGADILAHSVEEGFVDDSLLAAMRARDAIYIPTLAVGQGYAAVFGRHVRLSPIEQRLGDPDAIASFDDLDAVPRHLVPGWVRPRRPQPLDPMVVENLRRVQAHGIRIAAGSDAGNIGTLHGPALHRELELMVQAGLTPLQALTAAAQGGAAVMGRSADLGTLAPGKLADLVVLAADPLADIRNTQRIHRVVKGGEMFDPEEIRRELAR
ncbi:MAG TPA: amidohydrolase family protein [Microvirga sp.]|nr:amidohydrolase family protein [Microvirga sp.]